MRESLFIEFIKSLFPKLSSLIEKVNGRRNKPLTYLHKTMLRKEYSADQKWESASIDTTYVTADMVSMDSPLPIKKRDAIAHANGRLPKIGMMKVMTESDINSLNVMKAQGGNYAIIAQKLAADAVAGSVSIDEKNEANFLCGLSNGYILVEDADNVGTALRVQFNYLPENCFGVETKGFISEKDIQKVIDKADADNNSIATVMMALSRYNKIRQSDWAKQLVANYRGISYSDIKTLPVPTASIFDAAFSDNFNGITIIKVDRSVISERNGVRKAYKPWNADKLVFLTDPDNVGRLVWGTLAEKTNPVNGVVYQTIDDFKLVAKFSETNPLRECTSVQALVLPVIENIDQIYTLDASEAQEVDTDAESTDTDDVNVTVWGQTYGKAGVIAELNNLGIELKATATDSEVVAAINNLSDDDENKLKAKFPQVSPKTLAFTSSADTTGKTIGVTSKGNFTVTSSADWATTSVNGKVITVTVTANTGSARTAEIAVKQGERQTIVTVTQEAGA